MQIEGCKTKSRHLFIGTGKGKNGAGGGEGENEKVKSVARSLLDHFPVSTNIRLQT